MYQTLHKYWNYYTCFISSMVPHDGILRQCITLCVWFLSILVRDSNAVWWCGSYVEGSVGLYIIDSDNISF